MKYGRYRGNYILWALYGLAVCACLALQAQKICAGLGMAGNVLYPAAAAAGCILLLFLVVFLPLRALSGKRKEKRDREQGIALWECLFLIFIAGAALALRLWLILASDRVPSGSMAEADLLMPAMTGAGDAGMPDAWGGVLRAYAWLLSGALSVFGRQAGTVFLVQVLLQMAGIMLLYPAVRMLSGKMAAVAATVAFAFWPLVSQGGLETGAENLFFFLYTFLLFQAALLLSGLSSLKGRFPGQKKLMWPYVIFSGLLVGAASLWEIRFLAVFLLEFLGMLLFKVPEGKMAGRPEEEETPDGASKGGKETEGQHRARVWPWVFLAASFAGAGLLLGLWTAAAGQLPAFGDIFPYTGNIMNFENGDFSGLLQSLSGDTALIPAVCLAVLYVFGFFEEKGSRGVIWILPFLFQLVLEALSGPDAAGSLSLTLHWLVFGGLGLQSACCHEPEEEREAQAGRKKKKRGEEAELQNTSANALTVLKPGEPIPNPLPVPKKHIRRQMDYAYEPAEHEMCYDIDHVEEGDDFEIP